MIIKTDKPMSKTLKLYLQWADLPDGQYAYDDEYFRIEARVVVDVWREDQD